MPFVVISNPYSELHSMVSGVYGKQVIELIKRRIKVGSKTADGRSLAVVVEGGAMRGTYTAGTLLAFHLMGAVNIFDAAYATSAGAINTAHFLSGIGHLKAATYYKALADGRFYNPWRLSKPVDVDFLFDVVLRKEISLEMSLLANSKTTLKVAMLNYENAVAEMKVVLAQEKSAWDTLKAAVAMPVVYNRTISLPGGRYVDGGVVIPYPLMQAIKDGMTDLVVLLSHDPTMPTQPRGLFEYILWSLVFAKGRLDLIQLLKNSHLRARELDGIITGKIALPSGVRILCIAPSNPSVTSSTQNRSLLRDSCIQMTKETLELFGSSQKPLLNLIDQGIM